MSAKNGGGQMDEIPIFSWFLEHQVGLSTRPYVSIFKDQAKKILSYALSVSRSVGPLA